MQLEIDGWHVTGRGVATDVVEASARAYLAAINRALAVAAYAIGRGRHERGRAVMRRSPPRDDPTRLDAGPRPYRIGVIGGDGTGPEVVAEGLKVLEAVREGFEVELDRLRPGRRALPADRRDPAGRRLEELREIDAIQLGAVGDPRVPPGILESDLLLRMRFELDQFVNLRPVIRYPGVQTLVPSHTEDDVNMVVVRENTEGLYSGVGGFHRKGTRHEVAVQSSVNTRLGVERIVRYASTSRCSRAAGS